MTLNKELLVEDAKKIGGLVFAFAVCAYGIIQIKVVNLGMAPWETLALGITNQTGVDFGKITQGLGFIIILFSIAIKIYPGMATILNMLCIGFFADVISKFNIVLVPQNYLLKTLVLFYGNIIMNIGIYGYLKYELGAGPRDGLMIGLVKITGFNVKYVRTVLESVVLLAGYLLGGTVGVGTIISAFSGGIILNKIFQLRGFDPKKTCQRKLTDYIVPDKENTPIENKE